MPNRLLREGIVDSESINALSPEGERMFYRLLVVADDFGRMDARPAILRARCFPLMETLSASKVDQWVNELCNGLLTLRYQSSGRPFLAIGRWDQRVRSHGKYPPPPDDAWQTYVSQLSDGCTAVDGLGLGKGLGKGAARGKPLLAAGEGDVVAKLPLNTGEDFSILASQKEEWLRLFPAANVDQELRSMEAWLIANPGNRKTAGGIMRFASAWLTKAQNRAPRLVADSGRSTATMGAI